eukprot:9459902-Alexandrium_andersonii.AAC.1
MSFLPSPHDVAPATAVLGTNPTTSGRTLRLPRMIEVVQRVRFLISFDIEHTFVLRTAGTCKPRTARGESVHSVHLDK